MTQLTAGAAVVSSQEFAANWPTVPGGVGRLPHRESGSRESSSLAPRARSPGRHPTGNRSRRAAGKQCGSIRRSSARRWRRSSRRSLGCWPGSISGRPSKVLSPLLRGLLRYGIFPRAADGVRTDGDHRSNHPGAHHRAGESRPSPGGRPLPPYPGLPASGSQADGGTARQGPGSSGTASGLHSPSIVASAATSWQNTLLADSRTIPAFMRKSQDDAQAHQQNRQ